MPVGYAGKIGCADVCDPTKFEQLESAPFLSFPLADSLTSHSLSLSALTFSLLSLQSPFLSLLSD